LHLLPSTKRAPKLISLKSTHFDFVI